MSRPAGHLVDRPGDRRTRCGLRSADVGVGWVRWAQAHIDGYGAVYCPDCVAGVDLAVIDLRLLSDEERRRLVGW